MSKRSRRAKGPTPTDCGHPTASPCRISIDPYVACQACARMVMLGGGGIVAAFIPAEAIPGPGGTLTLYRNTYGAFVYSPSTVGLADPVTTPSDPQRASVPR